MLELDSTAGYRCYWRGKDTSNIIFLDKRAKVKPDIVADAKQMPFREHIFDKIHSDPPHIIQPEAPRHREDWRNHPSFRGRKFNEEHQVWTMPEILAEKYTFWKTRSEAVSFMYHTNLEYRRILKPDGILEMKIIDGNSRRSIDLRIVRELYTLFTIEAINHARKRSQLTSNPPLFLTMKPNGNSVGDLSNHGAEIPT